MSIEKTNKINQAKEVYLNSDKISVKFLAWIVREEKVEYLSL